MIYGNLIVALCNGEPIHSKSSKLYMKLDRKGQLQISHDAYTHPCGDFGDDITWAPANTELLLTILASASDWKEYHE